MRRGLELYKIEHPGVSAILMGTRKGDPHGGQYCSLSLILEQSAYRMCSGTFAQKHDRRRLAAVRAGKPNNQLGLRVCVGFLAYLEGSVLLAV